MGVLSRADASMAGLIEDLQTLVRQPSVSATGHGIRECAELVRGMLEGYGIRSELLCIDGAAPAVFGEVRSKANPKKTILFYNHYDVQPAEPLERWKYPPFSGTRIGNKIFGRGAADDKGELITRMRAVRAFLEETGDVPCNVKFMIEGEEEIGSPHIEQYLRRHRKKLACDGVVWEFGYVDVQDRPIISLGMKGLLFAELSARGPSKDAHSSLAVLLENPAWRLVRALSTLRDESGRVLIRDWYKDAVPLSEVDMKIVSGEPFDEESFKREFGVRSFVGGAGRMAAKKAMVGGATCNIAGLVSGHTGDGAKTVLPSEAKAKLDFRLTPGMVPRVQSARLRRHLKAGGFGDIAVNVGNMEAAARTDPADPFVQTVRDAADASFGSSILSVSSAGTGPVFAFGETLCAPCVLVGSTHVYANIHSPNEFARTDLLRKATKCICRIMQGFSKQDPLGGKV